MPKLQDQAKQFQVLGIDEKLKIIPKLEREKQLQDRVNEEVSRVKEAIETLKECLPDTVFLSKASLDGLPHADLLKKQHEILEHFKIVLTQTVEQLDQYALTTSENLSPIQQALVKGLHAQEQQLENAFKEIPANQGKTGQQIGTEYQTLLKQTLRAMEGRRPRPVVPGRHRFSSDRNGGAP